jgi:hypothetical protein
MNRILFVLMLLALAACDSKSARLPEGVVGILHVDSGTDYVFRSAPTEIGGACAGWNTVSIQPPGQYSTGKTNLMCWKEKNGSLHTATERAESATVAPMSAIMAP